MAGKAPDFNAFTVRQEEGKDDFWIKIGAMWAHGNGKGYNLILQALPLDGKIVLLTPKEDEEPQPDPKEKAKSYKK